MLNLTITRRFDLNLGKRCNLRCQFCYYLDQLKSGQTNDLDTEGVKKVLRLGRKWGKTGVDLTGGEPTIRNDLPELIEYAASIGYQTRCIITNGLVVSDNKKLSRLIEAGLNDILLSLHGHDAKTHDTLVGYPGAYAKVIRAIENAKNSGISTRINHVVNNQNYKNIMSIAKLASNFSPDALNFIVFNPTRDAINATHSMPITYKEIARYLTEMLTQYDDNFTSLNLRHIPFCIIKGFEKNVKTMWQLQYEKAEWDYCVDIIYKRSSLYMYSAAIFGAFLMLNNPRFYKTNNSIRLHDALQKARIFNDRTQPKACKKCTMRHICDGLPKDYVRKNGGSEVAPYTGKNIILDPTYFIPKHEIEV